MTHDWCAELGYELSHEHLYDEGVEAARNACVAGASIAAAAIVAAAYADNPLTGLPALRQCLLRLGEGPCEAHRWRSTLARPLEVDSVRVVPGFGFVTPQQAHSVRLALERLTARCKCRESAGAMTTYLRHHCELRGLGPLNAAGLVALVFHDHGGTVDQAERQWITWRTAVAMLEAQQTRTAGLKAFPFLSETLEYEGPRPPYRAFDRVALLREVGLE